jgi:hypothetical protein
MVPFPMVPTASSAERRLYEGFLSQLDDGYVVYHSVDWVLGPDRPGVPVVQGECDFLIAHPNDGLLVLEVKGGGIEFDPDTERWYQAGHGGRHPLDEDPFHQALGEMHSLVEILSHQPGWRRWRPSYGYGVAFPDAAYTTDAHPGAPAACTIDRDAGHRLAGRVAEIMAVWHQPDRHFGPEGMRALHRALGFRMEILAPLGLQWDEDDRRIVELTDDQSYVLSNLVHLRRAAVVGPAGAGKTLLALHIATRLAAGGTRTLLACVHERLAESLRTSAKDTPNLDVLTLDELALRLAHDAGLPAGPSGDGPDLMRRAATQLGPRYRAMVVDESQDVGSDWWPALLGLHERPTDGTLFVFSDDRQEPGGPPPGLGESLPTLPLPANLRSAAPIHEFVSVFYPGAHPPPAPGATHGRPVEVLAYRDDADLRRLLVRVLANLEAEGVGLDEVVLLLPSQGAADALLGHLRLDGFRLSSRPEPDALLASTIEGFMGLERAVVILAGIDQVDPDDRARTLYAGASRARNHLLVLATEPVARELRTITGVIGA